MACAIKDPDAAFTIAAAAALHHDLQLRSLRRPRGLRAILACQIRDAVAGGFAIQRDEPLQRRTALNGCGYRGQCTGEGRQGAHRHAWNNLDRGP